MLYGFGRKRTPRRCCLSIDLKKAFDTIRWEAIFSTFETYGFSPLLCKMIWNCISTVSFPVLVEGTSTPFFRNQGIRQGDPLSPILFDMVVDVLSKLIERSFKEKD